MVQTSTHGTSAGTHFKWTGLLNIHFFVENNQQKCSEHINTNADGNARSATCRKQSAKMLRAYQYQWRLQRQKWDTLKTISRNAPIILILMETATPEVGYVKTISRNAPSISIPMETSMPEVVYVENHQQKCSEHMNTNGDCNARSGIRRKPSAKMLRAYQNQWRPQRQQRYKSKTISRNAPSVSIPMGTSTPEV